MKYIISGRNLKISEVAENEADIKRRAAASAQPRDSEGRYCAKGDKPKQKWTRLFVLAKPMK